MMELVILWSWLIWRVNRDMVLMIFLGGNSIMKSWYGGLGFIRSHRSVRVALWGAECAGEAWLEKWCLHGIGEWMTSSCQSQSEPSFLQLKSLDNVAMKQNKSWHRQLWQDLFMLWYTTISPQQAEVRHHPIFTQNSIKTKDNYQSINSTEINFTQLQWCPIRQ